MGPAGSASIGDTATKGAATLGGRSPAVLMVRELLYRTCEFNMNNNDNPAESRAIYIETLRIIEKIVTSADGAMSGTAPLDAEPGIPATAQPETSY
ncbi:hypothetical protein VT06_16325 [Arsukibacterium sp. MJ3]|nr:hypothetical protein VT06_16325 [Arsukibacterium sp. MJ3]